MEKLNILDVLLTYKNDSDKIAILGRALEMLFDYTDRIEDAFSTINGNIQTLAAAVTALDGELKRINGELMHLTKAISSDMSRLETTVDTVKETTAAAASRAPAPVAASTSHRASVVEETLMKPSQFGKSLGGTAGGAGPSPLGGGMSIRSAMMAEIKQRMRGSAPAGGSSEGAGRGEIGGGYIPKIHQPRAAEKIEGGLVKKMNKLLDSKFQKMPPSGGAPRGPPSARGPPRAPPSAKSDKKKDKKKKKDKDNSQLSDLQRKIRDKLG
ncbi:MAG: hypothetical protein HWN66_10410 [Candidatus Helarchaeota archaeon]|nr:hypothetical protein [Candidatus Helarchaeota archaeon]